MLITRPDGLYVDGTVGGGGHSRLILDQLSGTGRLIGLDRDPEAVRVSRERLDERARVLQMRFSQMASALGEELVDGVLFDFGVSSHQLDVAERGFSYRFDAPLDLRMTPDSGRSARELLSGLSEHELGSLLRDFGEEPQWRRITKAIMRAREQEPIETTGRLAAIVSGAVPATSRKSLPRVFQALRIAVNEEILEIERGLEAAFRCLRSGGRLVTITYHSLEDRPVKEFMNSRAKPQSVGVLPTPLPTPTAKLLTRKPLLPSEQELQRNPRSRSAKLRALEKL